MQEFVQEIENITFDVSICTFSHDVCYKKQKPIYTKFGDSQHKHQTTYKLSSTDIEFTGYQQGIYYSEVRVYNYLPPHIKQLSDDPKNFEL